mmetsp:Transcript_101306/g.295053  ORF Transcript_101306/g.295053 Transcript_101306/m.295053 type:complete len:326 (+) Transcript_101306:77-1054(+)
MPHANYLTASLAVLCGACFIAIPMAPSLVTEELDTAQMAFMADDECRERDCALAALQLRSSLDTVTESNVISMLSDDRTAFAEAPSAPTGYGAWNATMPVTSNARSTANSSSSPLSNATATSTGNSTPNASSEADSGPPAGDHSAPKATARKPAPGTTPPATADSADGSSTGNSSVQASRNETDKATGNKTGRAPSSSTPTDAPAPSDGEAPSGTNGSAPGNSSNGSASNGSAGGDRGNGTEAANTTGMPCSTCALYDPSSSGLDWTDILAPCYNLAQTKAMIEDGTWCCESFIPESMTAHPTSCFTAPNKGSWPCYSPDKTACS